MRKGVGGVALEIPQAAETGAEASEPATIVRTSVVAAVVRAKKRRAAAQTRIAKVEKEENAPE
jgi:hypothetical protein